MGTLLVRLLESGCGTACRGQAPSDERWIICSGPSRLPRRRGAEGGASERERETNFDGVDDGEAGASLSLADASQNHRSDQEGWEAPGPRGSRNDVQLLGPSAPGRQVLAVG